jgi:hypothetical protein
MKRTTLLFCLIITMMGGASKLFAQDSPVNEEVSLDLLQGPVSPAANMLGISNSQIEKPTDAAAFMTSVQTASGNFTTLPSSYAVDIAPAWIFSGDKITIQDYLSASPKYSIPQSFVISVATNTVPGVADSLPDDTRLSAGIKLSLFRGHISSETTNDLEQMQTLQRILAKDFDKALDSILLQDRNYQVLDSAYRAIINDPSITASDRVKFTAPLRLKMQQMTDSMTTVVRTQLIDEFEAIRQSAEAIRILRFGFKLDLSAGVVWDFPDLNMAQGQMSNAAVWLTGGYESPGGFSCLAIARYMYFRQAPFVSTPDEISYLNNNALDFGARLIYSNPSSKFGASAEGIYRYMMPNDLITPESTWRLTANLEYEVGRNKKLTLIVGRDFSGTLTTDGTLIAALNFLIGFGTNKKL